jgi:hypothetical protein
VEDFNLTETGRMPVPQIFPERFFNKFYPDLILLASSLLVKDFNLTETGRMPVPQIFPERFFNKFYPDLILLVLIGGNINYKCSAFSWRRNTL